MMDDGSDPSGTGYGDTGDGAGRRLSAPSVPGYEITAVLGRGAFGIVYRAWQPAFSRHVAIKVLMDTLDDRYAARLLRECQALGTASTHPNIVTVHEAGFTDEGRGFLVMEYLSGGSLADRLTRDGALPWQDVARIGVRLAGALETAHRAGVLHRDIKPDNVLLSDYGEPKLADFGIARLVGGTATRTGPVYASILYAAPEVLVGQASSTPASDVYALGGTLLTLLTGHPPFVPRADEPVGALIARIVSNPPELLVPDVPVGLLAVIGRAMAKGPADRQATAAEFGAALREVQQEEEGTVTEMAIGVPALPDQRPPAPATDSAAGHGPHGRPATPPTPAKPPGRARAREPWLASRTRLIVVVAVATLIGVLATVGAADSGRGGDATTTAASARSGAGTDGAGQAPAPPPTTSGLAPSAVPPVTAVVRTAVGVPAAAHCAASISYGQTVACTIATAGGVKRHDFTGTAGDHVYVRVVRLSGDFSLVPSYSVLGPAGAPDCPDRPDCPLKTSGRHTIVVHDSLDKATGDYALYLQRTDDPAGCAAIGIGEAADGTLQFPGSMACAAFTAGAGDRVRITAVGTGEDPLQFPELNVLSVDRGDSACPAQDNCALGAAGRYIVLAAASKFDNPTGPFRITVTCLAGPCRAS